MGWWAVNAKSYPKVAITGNLSCQLWALVNLLSGGC